MVSMDVEDVVELWTCSKKRSEDVVESGRRKNFIRRSNNGIDVMTT